MCTWVYNGVDESGHYKDDFVPPGFINTAKLGVCSIFDFISVHALVIAFEYWQEADKHPIKAGLDFESESLSSFTSVNCFSS